KRLGKKRWRKHVNEVTAALKVSLGADYVVLGGGNVKKLKDCPPGCVIGSNENAFTGGLLIWGQDMKAHPVVDIGTAAGSGRAPAKVAIPSAVARAEAKSNSKLAKTK
ncbi:MAG TPA: hypothetical protein VHP80_15160, partial [Candidatus Acidoferrum sp.]|nr:hypothetical protein [Candidatus Acidoferrum sp.]